MTREQQIRDLGTSYELNKAPKRAAGEGAPSEKGWKPLAMTSDIATPVVCDNGRARARTGVINPDLQCARATAR